MSEKDLNDFGKKSIARYFFKCFNNVSVSPIVEGDERSLWSIVKDVVYQGILEKRNAVTHRIRLKWEGKFVVIQLNLWIYNN